MKEMNIPVGVSDFEEIRKNGYYYIDKSGLIGELISRTGTKVTLITRPRRFGKTLGMSMLESFFDIRKDSRKLFEGLEITKNQALCDEWMNQYPTIFVSFRQVDGLNFTGAYDMLTMVIADLYNKHLYLLDSENATEFQKTAFEHARVAIFEAKYTKVLENLESECDTALQQIDDRMYAKEYEDDYDQILCYGISFFKKRCMVKKK